METWTRFELVDELGLTFRCLSNVGDPTYTYFKDIVEVNLRHIGLQYWFTLKTDDNETISSIVYEDYTNMEKFISNFNSFCKFFNVNLEVPT